MRTLLTVALALLAGCGETDDPVWCTQRAPLTINCPGPYCVGALVIDYKRLEPRGFRVFTLEGSPIDELTARARAVDHVQKVLKQPPPDQVEVRAEIDAKDPDFYEVYLRYEETGDSWLVILHAQTGQLLFAGIEEWANPFARGYDFPLPDGFQGTEALGCERGAHEPEAKKLVTTGVPTGSAPASTVNEAWRLARSLNLTVRLIGERPYRALVISYARAAGEFDPDSADWQVWLARR